MKEVKRRERVYRTDSQPAAERGAQVTSRAQALARPRVAYWSRRGVPREDVTLGGKRGKTGPRKNAEKRKNRWYLWWGGSGSNRRRPDYESCRRPAKPARYRSSPLAPTGVRAPAHSKARSLTFDTANVTIPVTLATSEVPCQQRAIWRIGFYPMAAVP